MIVCLPCARASALCLFNLSFSKCAKCIRKDVSYDDSFSKAEYDKLSEEQAKLKVARSRHIAELISLDKRVEVLKKTKRAMLAKETWALKKLEREKRAAQ
jgi:hypothetical protein